MPLLYQTGLIQRCELAGDAESAVIRTKPGLAKQFPLFADLFVDDFGARVPIAPIGSLPTASLPSQILRSPGSCPTTFTPRQANGPVMTKPRIQNLYWGVYWQSSPGLHEMVAQDDAWAIIASDWRYYTLLAQYSLPGESIVAGSWIGHNPGVNTTVNNTSLGNNTFVTQATLETELVKEIPFTPPDQASNTIYVIYLPPGVSTPKLSGNFAYHWIAIGDAHDAAHPGATRSYFYAVIGYPALSDGTMNFDSANISETHEIDETITDPTLNQGWRDNGPPPGNEIGDDCNRLTSDFFGFTIQKEWDQASCMCSDHLPQPAAPTAPQNCMLLIGCNDNVEVRCDMINEGVVLQREVNGTWITVSSDTDLPRLHIPFLYDQPSNVDYATYRTCGTNSQNDLVCAPNLTTGVPHSPCGPGGGIGGVTMNCRGSNQPKCGPHHIQ